MASQTLENLHNLGKFYHNIFLQNLTKLLRSSTLRNKLKSSHALNMAIFDAPSRIVFTQSQSWVSAAVVWKLCRTLGRYVEQRLYELIYQHDKLRHDFWVHHK